MRPNLHNSIIERVEPLHLRFYRIEDTTQPIDSSDTNILGHFRCKHRACSGTYWSSGAVATNIRLYRKDRYNARIFHQRCQKCESLCRPEIDEETYVDRVVYRLKKWHDMEVEAPDFTKKDDDKPHLSHLCEGCKAGHCKIGQRRRSA
jgi:hypothetical protein